MMNQELARLKKSIKKKLIKDLSFDSNNDDISFRISLTGLEYRELLKEAGEINVSKVELDKLIDEVKATIKFEPRVKEVLKILPAELYLGQYIRLKTNDETGEAIEELIYIGKNSFILVKHERGSLQLMDELRCLISPWNVGGYVDFNVFRNNKQVIKEDNHTIYRTKTIQNIQFLEPQFDFDEFYKEVTDYKSGKSDLDAKISEV